jgi:hypothetical protein
MVRKAVAGWEQGVATASTPLRVPRGRRGGASSSPVASGRLATTFPHLSLRGASAVYERRPVLSAATGKQSPAMTRQPLRRPSLRMKLNWGLPRPFGARNDRGERGSRCQRGGQKTSFVVSCPHREKQIKAGSRRKKIELVEGMNPEWVDFGGNTASGSIVVTIPLSLFRRGLLRRGHTPR